MSRDPGSIPSQQPPKRDYFAISEEIKQTPQEMSDLRKACPESHSIPGADEQAQLPLASAHELEGGLRGSWAPDAYGLAKPELA